MIKKTERKYPIRFILIILFIIAIFLRGYGLSENLFFGPEQGVDFFRIKEIVVDHHPVLVGAKTDVAGIFHGPIYFYISTVPFLLSGGDPVFIAFFLIVLNSASVFVIYKLGKALFNRNVGIISAALFTLSFGAISYSRWLSSHPLTIPLSALFLLFFVNFLEGQKKKLYLASIALGLMCQAEFLNYLFMGAITIVMVIVFYKEFKKLSIFSIAMNIFLFFIAGVLSYVIFEIKNNFIMSKSLLALSFSDQHKIGISFRDVISQTFETFALSLSRNTFPPSIYIALVILIIGIIFLYRSKFDIAKRIVLIWTIVPIVLLIIIRKPILEQFFVYYVVLPIILLGYLLYAAFKWNRIVGGIFIVIVLAVQVYAWIKYVPQDNNMFYQSTQPNLKISDEYSVIDSIYKRQNGKDFSFQSYTIPYWYQQAWQYLFWQYGEKKYGYLPLENKGKDLYVIVQDEGSLYQKNWLKNTVSKWGEKRGSFRKGIFNVLLLRVQ